MLAATQIRAIIAEAFQLESDSWSEESSVYDLGIDSLRLATLIAHCEARLSLNLSDDSINRIMAARTIGQIVHELQLARPHDQAVST